MSEYQYYEFQAVDQPLDREAQQKVGALSSRVQLTATSAVFTYSYGDFPGKAETILERYFDALLYLANWGTRRLLLRLPRQLITLADVKPYCIEDVVAARETERSVLLDICIQEEGGEWIEGDGELSPLLPLRQKLLDGDLRMLYVAWLKGVERLDPNELGERSLEPPVPPGLGSLSPELEAFVDFFELNTDLLEVASEGSPEPEKSPDFARLLPNLPSAERDEYLLRLLRGEPHLAVKLRRSLLRQPSPVTSEGPGQRRTVPWLLNEADARRTRREEQERNAAEKARIQRLKKVVDRESQLWEEAFALASQKQIKSYDAAAKILKELKEASDHFGRGASFQTQLNSLRQQFSKRPGLQSRLREAGLFDQD